EQGADINNKPNGGSSVVDNLFESSRFEFGHFGSGRFGLFDVWRIEAWMNRGARWVPDDDQSYRDVRKALRDLGTGEAWKFMEFLSRTVDEPTLVKLCKTTSVCAALGEGAKGVTTRI